MKYEEDLKVTLDLIFVSLLICLLPNAFFTLSTLTFFSLHIFNKS